MSVAAVPADALEAGLDIAAAFESRAIPYALGGALAYGLWAVPRGTVDVDLNVFAEHAALGPAFEALESLGIEVDTDQARRAAERDGMFVVRYGPWRVDLFTPSIPFAWEAARTRVLSEVAGRAAWFLSAESLAVFKLLFFRGKDRVDLERLVATQRGRMNVSYVREQIVEMMGDGDPRVKERDELVDRFGRE